MKYAEKPSLVTSRSSLRDSPTYPDAAAFDEMVQNYVDLKVELEALNRSRGTQKYRLNALECRVEELEERLPKVEEEDDDDYVEYDCCSECG